MRILAIGECMAELAPADAAKTYALGFAGDTFNTAWYLARTAPELQVSYLSGLGTDALSQELRGFMRDAGIDDSKITSHADRSIGLYLISLEAGERSFSYWRGQSAARRLADDPDHLAEAMSGADLVFFSGITLAILEDAARQTLLDALAEARGQGKQIVFDPNLRPRLWAETAQMTHAIMQAAAVSDLALPSFEDEAEWFGDADPVATAERYRGAGVRTVIVKNGAAPVYYLDGAQTGEVAVPAIDRLVDTTAAGDSFNAGLLAGLAASLPLEDSIARAITLAGKVVLGKGALVDISAV